MARVGRALPVRPVVSRGPVAPALAVSTLQDNFDDNSINTTLWPGNYGSVFETSQLAVVECATGYSGFQSARIYGLVESEVIVQVYPPAAGGATTAANAEVVIGSDQQPAGTTITIQADALTGVVWAYLTVGFADVGTPASVPLSTNPVWVRIRESGGQLTWWTSPTGTPSSWGSPLRTEPTPAWVTTSAVGVILQAHRSDGTNDFASFDNVGLAPADPIPAPAPIVIKGQRYRPRPPGARISHGFIPPDPDPVPPPIIVRGQRYRPLPPGAIISRSPDRRPAPSNRVAVALDGSLAIPLSVRLTSDTADVLLVAEVRDVSFRSVIPGGFASATVTLDRPLDQAVPEVALYGRMFIYDTRSGETVWEGRVEDPGKSAGSDGTPWQITAVGPSAHAKDQHFPYIPIDTSINHFEKFGGSKGSTTVSQFTDSNDDDGIKVAFPGGTAAATPQYVAARSLRIYNAGLELGSVRATAYSSDTSPSWDMRMYVYTGGGSPELIDSNTITTSPTSYYGEVGTEFTSGADVLHLRMDKTTSSSTPTDEVHTFWYDAMVRTRLVDEEGVAVTDYSDDYVLSSQIVQDLIGAHTTQFDGLDAFIQVTTQQLTQLAYDSTTVYDVLNDIMALEGSVYWAAWETVARSGLWRFEFRYWPTTIRYECGVDDGWDSPGSAADLFNRANVTWTNKVSRQVTTTLTSTVDVLDRAGLTRSDRLDLGQEVGSATAATTAGQNFLAEHALPSQSGRLTVARPILDYDLGQMVDPWQIRPGGLIRLRGVDPLPNALNPGGRDGSTVFRIISTSFRASDGTCELELDSDALSTSRAIARLQQRRTRR